MASTDFITEAQLDALAAAIAARINTRRSEQGSLGDLTTTATGSIVAAINELDAALGSAGATISDGTTGTGTVWSSQKVADYVAAAVTSLLGGASAAYDTLGELQALMAADDTETSGIMTALGNRLRFDAAQTLDSTQKAQGKANLGIVASTTDFAAAFNTATA